MVHFLWKIFKITPHFVFSKDNINWIWEKLCVFIIRTKVRWCKPFG